jgi:hypothetical protein
VAPADHPLRGALLRRGFALEYLTLAWNVTGIVVLAIATVAARSVALAGFGLDSLIEIGASTVVIWELSGTGEERQRRGLQLIGCAFAALAVYLLVQSTVVLAAGYHPGHSGLGIIWTAVTAAAMFALAAGKARTGRALNNPVLRTEGRVTVIDGILAVGPAARTLGGASWRPPGSCSRPADTKTSQSGTSPPPPIRPWSSGTSSRRTTCSSWSASPISSSLPRQVSR